MAKYLVENIHILAYANAKKHSTKYPSLVEFGRFMLQSKLCKLHQDTRFPSKVVVSNNILQFLKMLCSFTKALGAL